MALGIVKTILEKIDQARDWLLFPLIKKFWPRFITPNHLSFLKIVVGLALGILLFSGLEDKTWIIFLFCLTLFLDLFDGSVARALNKKTKLGAFIDPVGDKTLIVPIAVFTLTKLYYSWLLFFLILPEAISSVGAAWCHKKRQPIESNIFGKTKMVLQSVAFGLILLHWPSNPSQFSITLLWIAVVLAIISLLIKWLGFQKEN